MQQEKDKDQVSQTEANGNKIFFSHEEAGEFKDLYNKTIDEHKTSFRYNNEEFNTVYARYIISYLAQHGY